MAEQATEPSSADGPTVIVAGNWTRQGVPDATTTVALSSVAELAGRICAVDLAPHRGDPGLVDALGEAALSLGAAAVVLPAGPGAESLATALAARSRGMVALDVRRICASDDGFVVYRPTYGGAFDAEFVVPPTQLLVATFDSATPDQCGSPTPHTLVDIEITPGAIQLIERIDDGRDLALSGARRIVAGGRGVGGPEGFAELEVLAEALGAALGASRPPCDAGWVPGRHQVGITGARVAPELYVAIGISGSVQHRAGMQSSRTVVAINNDAQAPMLGYADLAVVADWREVVAGMLDELATQPGTTEGANRCG